MIFTRQNLLTCLREGESEQVEEVLDLIKKHINLEVIITGEPHHIQKWQYPMDINYFKEANLPLPVFENIQEGFCVTIFGENKDLENESKDLENELSEIQIKIVHEIKTNPFITQKELKKIIGINEKNIRNNMRKLKNIGILQRIGPDKGGYWTIIDNPNN
jgi:predicted HTH transcriptional regulator